jgi:predicted GNAT family acetyltransferase
LDVEVLVADDWETLRDVRLRALKDSPTAYISTYEEVASWTEERWRGAFATAVWVVIRSGRRIVGVASSLRAAQGLATERYIESVWVEPGHRRSGILREILRYLAELEPVVEDWFLWVLDGNADARAVYERLGFAPTGESQPLADASGRKEVQFRLTTLDLHSREPD